MARPFRASVEGYPPRRGAGRLLGMALLALALPAASWAGPVAASGAAPASPAPARGVDLYLIPGAPAAGAGAEVGLGGFALGTELAWLWPGALRPELHVRWPFALGSTVLSPHLSTAFSLAGNSFGSAPAASTLEVGAGLTAGVALGRFTPLLDLGVLGVFDPRYRSHARFFTVGSAGLQFQATSRIGLGGWVGTLASVGRFAPAGGIWVTLRIGAGDPPPGTR